MNRDFLRRLFRIRPRTRDEIEAEFRDEIEAHVALATDYLVRRGVPPDEARRLARARFGEVDRAVRSLVKSAQIREHSVQRREWWDTLGQNARVALRQMRRAPALTCAITASLAIGIGANLVMFQVVDRLLLSPPPGVTHADAVRRLILPEYNFFTRGTSQSVVTNYATYADLRAVHRFARVAAFGFPTGASLGRGSEASAITTTAASASFFDLLGVQPYLGRFYSEREDAPPNGSPVAVVGYGYWKRALGGESGAIGHTLLIDGKSYTIIGVAPPRFNGLDVTPVDVWLPLTGQSFAFNADYLTDRGSLWLQVVARLAPHGDERAVVAEASAAVLRNNETVSKANPHAKVELASIIAARGPGNHPDAMVALWLLGVSAAVLLIACANVTTLLLTRAVQRHQEIAIRLALGVSRWRLLQQLLAEAAAIAVLAAIAAFIGAELTRGAVERLLMPDVAIDYTLSSHTAIMMGVTMLFVIGAATLAPSLHALGVDVSSALKESSRSVSDSRPRIRGALLVLQVALSVMLLVGAGLFVQSLHNAQGTRLGIDTDRVLLAQVDLTAAGMDSLRTSAFWDEAVRRVTKVPHVTSASLSIAVPMMFSMAGSFIVPGRDSIPKLETGGPYKNGVDAHYFSTIGARILRGRAVTAADTRGSPKVVVINESMARRIWPNENPIGACVRIFRADTIPCATIVGVVEDIHHHQQIREGATFQYYVPYSQWIGGGSAAMLVRLDGPARGSTIASVRRALQAISPDTPFPQVVSYAEIIDPQLRPWKLGASMFSAFGVLAFVVSVVGLYGLLSYLVTQRRYELGIRAALGAQAGRLMSLVLGRALALIAIGLGVGLALAAVLSQRLAPLLLDVSPHDWRVYGWTAALAAITGLATAVLPARRAASVDPIEALRSQ